MVNVSLFLSHFSQETSVQRENYRGLGHAVERFCLEIESRFNWRPLPPAGAGELRLSIYLRISELRYESPIKKE